LKVDWFLVGEFIAFGFSSWSLSATRDAKAREGEFVNVEVLLWGVGGWLDGCKNGGMFD